MCLGTHNYDIYISTWGAHLSQVMVTIWTVKSQQFVFVIIPVAWVTEMGKALIFQQKVEHFSYCIAMHYIATT